ncbi:GDP-mannose 4,6-dehydratase [Cohnella fermenti]|uniref:NAD-dependent epimerase/dehydratase family protein n=1 Tax=Cohnella fermenti TaxID=2565925 RepID=A0A4S4C214_9BACL|nr:GDP-mannose 4,6-dehydratase [Cohnella fermenti]THF81714.1 NAD-dependent epimerase/dehydratase family protein [Cohnella fermenti]
MSTYLVTGGAGFIGSHLGDSLLASGHRVICLDSFSDSYDYRVKMRNILPGGLPDSLAALSDKEEALAKLKRSLPSERYRLETVDLRDSEALERIFESECIDAVIHLAALPGVRASIEQPLLFDDVNVRGTLLLLETMRKAGVRKWLCASSSSVYGHNEKVPFSESDPVDTPISLYAATKKSCELMGYTYYHLYGIDGMMLRFFTVYGPRQRPDLAIHKFARLIDQDREIPFYGDGTTKRDYTYVEDVVAGIRGALDYVEKHESVYEVLNLGNSRTVSLTEMVDGLESALGKKAILQRLPAQPGDMEMTCADIGKARRLIGYEPRTSFEEGIRNFVRWYGGRSS